MGSVIRAAARYVIGPALIAVAAEALIAALLLAAITWNVVAIVERLQ